MEKSIVDYQISYPFQAMCHSMLKDLLAATLDTIAIQPHFVVLM